MHFKNIEKIFIQLKAPSKYCYGCSNLWRGLPLEVLNKIIKSTILKIFLKRNLKNFINKNDEFLFRSARSAIYAILKFRDIGKGDQVIVSAFTCSAVTVAINSTGSQIIYTEINENLSMNFESIIRNITPQTKAVIIQNTFGLKGLSDKQINKLKSIGLLLIEDNCLSIGTKINNKELNKTGHFSVESLESSKSLTIGRGGIVRCNAKDFISDFKIFYNSLSRESTISDCFKIFQLWVNVFFAKYKIKNGYILWYFFYGMRIFKTSRSENKKLDSNYLKIGIISNLIYNDLSYYKKNIYLDANNVFNKVKKILEKNNANLPINYKKEDFIITPRIPIIVPRKNIEKIFHSAIENNIEISRWFQESPPLLNISKNINKSSSVNNYIKSSIINIPTYCTNQNDMDLIYEFVNDIKHLI